MSNKPKIFRKSRNITMKLYPILTSEIENLEKGNVSSEKIIEIYEDILYEKTLTFGDKKLVETLLSLERRFYEGVDKLPYELTDKFCKYYWNRPCYITKLN